MDCGPMNGMALHGGVLPVGGTFFVFSDYARASAPPGGDLRRHTSSISSPMTRSASARTARRTSPIEQLASLQGNAGPERDPPGRCQPRPQPPGICCRGREPTVPTALVLSRQEIPVLTNRPCTLAPKRRCSGCLLVSPGRARGCQAPPDIVLIGTGSEVQHCLSGGANSARGGRCGRLCGVGSRVGYLFERSRLRVPRRCAAPGRAASGCRGRRLIRLGALCGHDGQHRPLRLRLLRGR